MGFPAAQHSGRRRFRAFRAIGALMLREMASTYGRSPGGYVWMILEPAAGLALLSFVFGLMLRSPPLGTNFPYFFAGGLLPFTFYTTISMQISKSLNYSRPFLAYPAVTFLDALLARFLLNALTQMLVMVVVVAGIVLVYDLRPIMDWSAIFLAMAMLFALTISIGVMNCFLFGMFPLWERLWTVVNRPMFVLSGVLHIPENVPMRFRDYYMLNPIAHITSQMRKGFFATYEASYVNPTYVFIISFVLLSLGLLFLLKNHKDIALK